MALALRKLLALKQAQVQSLTRVALKVHLVRKDQPLQPVLIMALALRKHLVLNQDQDQAQSLTLVVPKVLQALN